MIDDGTPAGRSQFAIGWLVFCSTLALCAWATDSAAARPLILLAVISAVPCAVALTSGGDQ